MRIVNMQYNAGIQLYGRNKPLVPPVHNVPNLNDKKDRWDRPKNMKQRKEKLLKQIKHNRNVDKRTLEFLEKIGLINTKKKKI